MNYSRLFLLSVWQLKKRKSKGPVSVACPLNVSFLVEHSCIILALGYHDALCPRCLMSHANRGIKNDLGLASLRGTLNSEDVCRNQCDRVGKYELGVKAIGTGCDLHDVLLSSLCPQDWKLLEHRDLPLYSVPSHA